MRRSMCRPKWRSSPHPSYEVVGALFPRSMGRHTNKMEGRGNKPETRAGQQQEETQQEIRRMVCLVFVFPGFI